MRMRPDPPPAGRRSTAAGRRLFNLYYGNNIGKDAGKAYSTANRLAHQQKMAAGAWSLRVGGAFTACTPQPGPRSTWA
jgi:hypothetical protein